VASPAALRAARQRACFSEEPPIDFWAVIDEGVLRRRTGGTEVMRAQIEHLHYMSEQPHATIQVMPQDEGWHPGTAGSFSILTFPEKVHSPVAYVESQAGDMYLEREEDMRRISLTYTHLHAAALSASKSRELMKKIIKDLA